MENKKVMVHSYMIYACDKCKEKFKIYCEKGVEDRNIENYKPSPFVIMHKCGGFATDKSGLIPSCRSDKYIELPDNEAYFAYDESEPHGIVIWPEPKKRIITEYELQKYKSMIDAMDKDELEIVFDAIIDSKKLSKSYMIEKLTDKNIK